MFLDSPYLNYSIKQFDAITEPKLSADYHRKHLEVLAAFGVGPLGSTLSPWYQRSTVRVFMALNDQQEIVGGLRLECLNRHSSELPLSHAIAVDSPDLLPKIDLHKGRLAELCGAWLAPEARKKGLLMALTAAAIDYAYSIELDYLISLSSAHSRYVFDELGFSELPNKKGISAYKYPDSRYLSTLMELDLSLQPAQASAAFCN